MREGWPKVTLGEVASRITQRNRIGNENVLTISAQYGLVSQEEFFQRRVASADTRQYYLLHHGDFAYNKSYSDGYPAGVVRRLDQYKAGVVSPLYICFKPDSERIDSKFLSHYFEAGLLDEDILWIAKEGVRNHGLLNVKVGDFFSLPIRLPPLAEQQRIAEILDTIDEQAAALNRVALKLNAAGESAVAETLQVLVAHTEWTTVGEQFDVSAGITLGPDRSLQDNPHGYLRVANVQRGVIDLEDVAELQARLSDFPRRALRSGDLLVVEGHASPNEIGRCARVPVAAAGLLYQNHLFRLRSRSVTPEFGEIWLNSRYARNYWRRICATSSGLNTINSKMLGELRFPLCDADQQVRVIKLAGSMNLAVHDVKSELTKLGRLKSALMDDLLTGRVRVLAETLAEV